MINESLPPKGSKVITSKEIKRNFKNPDRNKYWGLKILFAVLVILLLSGGYFLFFINDESSKTPAELSEKKAEIISAIPPQIDYDVINENLVLFEGNSYDVFEIGFNDQLYKHIKFKRNISSYAVKDFARINKGNGSAFPENERVFKNTNDFFAITAAMYEASDNLPPGLVISDGSILKPINKDTGKQGNFYLEPNGVFYLDKDEADIVVSRNFDSGIAHDFALQSGPMLIVNDQINPSLGINSSSKLTRCAVGVSRTPKGKRILFICSRTPVTFYELGKVMKEKHGCQNALHLESGAYPFIYWSGGNFKDNTAVIQNFIIIS